RFQLQKALGANEDLKQQLESAEARWITERDGFKQQLAALQVSVIEALESSNNPRRTAMAVREQVEARLASAKLDWAMQLLNERRRFNAETERLKASPEPAGASKDVARRAVLEKLGKLPAAASGPASNADRMRHELEAARNQWDAERAQLTL